MIKIPIQVEMEERLFAEKEALGRLEEAKAHERVKEIAYEHARYRVESFKAMIKEQQNVQGDLHGESSGPAGQTGVMQCS